MLFSPAQSFNGLHVLATLGFYDQLDIMIQCPAWVDRLGPRAQWAAQTLPGAGGPGEVESSV